MGVHFTSQGIMNTPEKSMNFTQKYWKSPEYVRAFNTESNVVCPERMVELSRSVELGLFFYSVGLHYPPHFDFRYSKRTLLVTTIEQWKNNWHLLGSSFNFYCLPKGRHNEAAHEKRFLCAQKCTRGRVGWGGVGHVWVGWGGSCSGGVGWVM